MARKGIIAIAVPVVLSALLTAGAAPAQSQVPLQSPIDITPSSIRINPHLPQLEISYGHHAAGDLHYVRKDAAAANGCTVRDHEETEEFEVEPGAGHVTLSGVRYDLVQFHFHTPSEHRFAGHADPLEMHLVHRSAAGALLVIGVPLRVGAASTVDSVLAHLAPECGEEVHLEDIDLNTLLPVNRATARYTGSLTTAPFTEGVQWFVMGEKTVTQATVSRFQSLFYAGNARPVQPLNGRKVEVELPHL
ncbi:carbonic anhydrase family protein [Saccharothrix sp. S26]|uniref:carbonic anhydrase family protein n=1 Tax=Saccharothrix sp. S26 TaxID=2907215 RepID=UPI001F4045FE|nr:carbonic anhydrase family protein [Saccharothrix sp. S26]MCE7000668.1 carbonic anhydrase family protein [Saccharothrix sp. S26]